MHHAFLDKYSDIKSPIHRLDARVKIIVLLILLVFISTASAYSSAQIMICAAIIFGVWFAARIPIMHLVKRIAIAAPFFVVASATLAWSARGKNDFAMNTALFIMAKAALSIAAISLLTSTTPFPKLLAALSKLRVPSIILSLLSFLYRFAYILTDEFERLDIGRKSRELTQNLGLSWRGRAWMLGTFLIRSLERSERVYSAMLSRGYNGE